MVFLLHHIYLGFDNRPCMQFPRVPIEVVASSSSTSPSMHVTPHSHEDVDEQVTFICSEHLNTLKAILTCVDL